MTTEDETMDELEKKEEKRRKEDEGQRGRNNCSHVHGGVTPPLTSPGKRESLCCGWLHHEIMISNGSEGGECSVRVRICAHPWGRVVIWP